MSGLLRLAGMVLGIVVASSASFAADPPPLTRGQTVYVPVYSYVLHGNLDRRGNADTRMLATTLAIRNTDPARAMTVRSIRYYDTDGKLIRDYLTEPKRLGPMATTETFIEARDRAGGSGANFLVVWDAEAPINSPIIEAVHANFFGTQSVAFVSPGQALHVDAR